MDQQSMLFKTKDFEQRYMDAYEQTLSLWPVEYESIYMETQYGTTHILTAGPIDGEPLILLNGFGFSATMWYPNVKTLSATYRVYAVDVIGEFNRSRIKKDIGKKEDYAAWLQELLDQLNIDQAHFIGHSNGGWHVLNFTMHAVHRVKKIILLAPAASFAPFAKQFGIRLLAANVIRTRRMIINFCAEWFVAKANRKAVSRHLLEQFYHGIKGFGWKYKILIPSVYSDEELSKISVPTLLAIGDKEVIYNPKRVFERAKQSIRHLETLSLPEAGHAINIEKADELNPYMLEFLRS